MTRREHKRAQRLWTGDFTLLLGINLLTYVCCQSLNNGTPIYVSNLGGTTAFSGALILEFSLFAAIARIFAGRVIDNGTRKRVMVFGSVVMAAGTVFCIALPGLEPQLAFRALQGIGFGCMHTAAATAAADVLPKERLGEGIGYFGLGQSLGMAIGPTIAVVLTSMMFAESLFVGVAAIAVTLIVLVLCCTYERHPQRLPETSAYRMRREREDAASGSSQDAGPSQGAEAPQGADAASKPAPEPAPPVPKPSIIESLFVKSALCGAIPMLIACLGYSTITNFASLYGKLSGFSNPGMFFVLAAVTMTAVRLGGGRLIDAIKPIRLLALPLACGIAALAMMANAQAEIVFWIAGAFFGLSMGLAFPLLNSVCVKNTVPQRWGAASALFGLMNDVGVGCGALAWGAIADVVGFVPVMYGSCLMLAAAYVAALLMFPKDI